MGDASTRAPAISLTAMVSERTLQLDAPGRPTLLLLVAQESADQVDPVVEAVREVYPDTAQLRVATVIDGRKFPRVVRGVAEALIKSRFNDEAKKLEPGQDPADWIYIIPDWEAEVMQALGIESVGETIAVAALAADGTLHGPYQGEDTASSAVELVKKAAGG